MPHETRAIDIRKLIAAQQPDAEGNVIPAAVQYGSVVVSSAKGEAEHITVALSDAVFNVATATCSGSCFNCNGINSITVTANPFACPVGGTAQLKATGNWNTGATTDETPYADWSSSNTAVATVSNSTAKGLVSALTPGSCTITAVEFVDTPGRSCLFPDGCPAGNQSGSGSGTVTSAVVKTADIVSDNIAVSLASGGTSTGTLTVTVVGNGVSGTPFSGTEGDGTYTFSFNRTSLPVGQYTQVKANWAVGQSTATGSKTVNFNVLGVYRHSQYNTPTESSCIGGLAAATKSSSSCTFTSINLKGDFIFQSWLNGSGITVSFGPEQNEAFCAFPPGVTKNVFRPVSSIVPSCGTFINNTTVAADFDSINHPLTCGDQVLIVGLVGQNVKTVTDKCPACKGLAQLDNYTTIAACPAGAFGDLGNFTTIRLR